MKRLPRISWAVASLLAPTAAIAADPCRLDEAITLYEKHQYATARPLLEACAAADSRSGRAAEFLGRTLLAERQEDRAVPWLEKAATLQPESSQTQLWLGRGYGQQARKGNLFKRTALAPKAHKAFERAVSLDPENIEARLALVDFYLIAPGILGGSVSKAQQQAGEIRRRDALKGHRAFGRIAENQKKPDAAAAEYEKAMTDFPERNEPVYWRANLAATQQDWARALELMESLLRSKPGELLACYQIGRIAALSGQRLERGEECLKLYLQHEPGVDEPPLSYAHLRLGAIYEKTGRKDLARQEYQNALRLDPTLQEAKQALAKLP